MGRIAILLLVIVTIIVLWKAFGPKTWNNDREVSEKGQFPQLGRQKKQQVESKGPDDDPDFLWNLKKERFKQQREAERLEQEAVERARRGEKKSDNAGDAKEGDSTQETQPQAKDEGETRGDNRGSTGKGGQEKRKDEGGASGA